MERYKSQGSFSPGTTFFSVAWSTFSTQLGKKKTLLTGFLPITDKVKRIAIEREKEEEEEEVTSKSKKSREWIRSRLL